MAQESKQDRELIELLNELRVILPGIQVMFAFLLMVPFNQRFPQTTPLQQKVYFASFLFATAATICLIAPTTYHRLRWREHDKEAMLKTSNRLAIAGTAFLAVGMTCVVFFITSFLFNEWTALVTALTAVSFAVMWYGIPVYRAWRDS